MYKLLKERIKWGIVMAAGMAISFFSSGEKKHATQAATVSLKKMLFSQTEEDNAYRLPVNNERGCLSAIISLKKDRQHGRKEDEYLSDRGIGTGFERWMNPTFKQGR